MSKDILDDFAAVAALHPQLTGPQFQQAAQDFASAYYSDARKLFDGEAFLEALDAAFKDFPRISKTV